jgi:hypothetical protein
MNCIPLWLTYVKENNFGQNMWDKNVVWIGISWGNTLWTLRTYWKLDENTLGTKISSNIPAPPPPKEREKKNLEHLGCSCIDSLAEQNFYSYIFWPKLMAGTCNWDASWLIDTCVSYVDVKEFWWIYWTMPLRQGLCIHLGLQHVKLLQVAWTLCWTYLWR